MDTFDKAKLSKLILNAAGPMTQKDFAVEIGISQEYLSRIISQKRDKPPSVKLLTKIADHTHNASVQLNDLLIAAGYANPKTNSESLSAYQCMTATLLTTLPCFSIPWTVIPNTDVNLEIHFTDGELRKWSFLYLCSLDEAELQCNYLKLTAQKIESCDKISFVTISRPIYNFYFQHRPHNLALNLSLILVDSNMKIIEETWLQSISLSSDSINRYTFPNAYI